MSSPLTVGTVAIVAVPRNVVRDKIRFQNVGKSILYFTRQIGITPNIPSATNYEFILYPAIQGSGSSTQTSEANEANIEIHSIARYNVVSSESNGSLAILETINL